MDAIQRAGRFIGVLIAVQLLLTVALRILQAPFFGAGGFLVNVAPHSNEVALNALLTLVIEALWVGVAVAAFPIFHERAPRMALLLVAFATVILAAAAAEAASIMSLIAVSDAYLKASPAGQEQLQGVRVVVSSARNGVFTVARLMDGAAAFVLYAALWRLALVPRWLAALGLVAAALWIVNVVVTVFGHHVVTLLLVPLVTVHPVLAIWLVAKGFRKARPIQGGALDGPPGTAKS